jgi:hypothetical protein
MRAPYATPLALLLLWAPSAASACFSPLPIGIEPTEAAVRAVVRDVPIVVEGEITGTLKGGRCGATVLGRTIRVTRVVKGRAPAIITACRLNGCYDYPEVGKHGVWGLMPARGHYNFTDRVTADLVTWMFIRNRRGLSRPRG